MGGKKGAGTGRGRKKAKALPPKMITVYGEILQETELAILVRCDKEADGAWLPKSLIKYAGERGDTGVQIQMPENVAEEKGFFDGMGYAEAHPADPPAAPAEIEKCCATCANNPFYGTDDAGREACKKCDDDHFHWKSHTEAASPAAETDEPLAGKRTFGENVKWIKEETITYTQPLDEAEKAKYADQMAELDEQIEELEKERSDVSSRLKKSIDAKEEERRELARSVRSGKEEREARCDCLKDYNTGEMVWTEIDPPHREVSRRKMTKEEQHPSLLEFAEKVESSADKAPEADTDAESDATQDVATEATDTEAAAGPGEGEGEQERTCANCRHFDGEDCNAPVEHECRESIDAGGMTGWEAIPAEATAAHA